MTRWSQPEFKCESLRSALKGRCDTDEGRLVRAGHGSNLKKERCKRVSRWPLTLVP